MTRAELQRRLVELEAELEAARTKTAGEFKVAIKYYLQVKGALARERDPRREAEVVLDPRRLRSPNVDDWAPAAEH